MGVQVDGGDQVMGKGGNTGFTAGQGRVSIWLVLWQRWIVCSCWTPKINPWRLFLYNTSGRWVNHACIRPSSYTPSSSTAGRPPLIWSVLFLALPSFLICLLSFGFHGTVNKTVCARDHCSYCEPSITLKQICTAVETQPQSTCLRPFLDFLSN